METLSVFEYGSFDEFEESLQQPTFSQLTHINITDIYLFMMYRCEDLFTGICWWRNKYMNCCAIFGQQRSEYGICYSFNSIVNDMGKSRLLHDPSYPWRTSNYGDWSGLRIEINAASTNSVQSDRNGVIVNEYTYFLLSYSTKVSLRWFYITRWNGQILVILFRVDRQQL